MPCTALHRQPRARALPGDQTARISWIMPKHRFLSPMSCPARRFRLLGQGQAQGAAVMALPVARDAADTITSLAR